MRRRLIAVHIVAVAATVMLMACSGKPPTETVKASKGIIRESIMEPARTRLEVRHQVSMPISARVARLVPMPGDPVKKGDRLVEVDIVPLDTAVAEARARAAELESRVALIRDTRVEEEMLISAEALAEERAVRGRREAEEFERATGAFRDRAISDSALDSAETASLAAEQARRQAVAETSRIRATIVRKELEARAVNDQLDQARAALVRAEHNRKLADIVSPVDGVILNRYEVGGGPLAEGTLLFLVGDLSELEVEGDLLTQDAFQLREGALVEYIVAPGESPLKGAVSRIEPAGFTKFSSLGVEQQRVFVRSTIESRPANLGLGFRLQARYYKGQASDAIKAPRSSVVQAPDGTFYVLKNNGGRIARQAVKLGLRDDFEVQVTEGLTEGDEVVRVPDTLMQEGQKL